MEQAVNTMSKGLQLDSHPMVQSNETLSDALNATFITMNGNETILLNDMGNRRVDNAYLPPGYEPVGIKEYGGVIYIAAYNPITGRSLIGSFPSPERRISKADDKDLGAEIDFVGDFKTQHVGWKLNPQYKRNIKWLITDTLMYPLTNKNSLHAGDKFVVYGFEEENVSNRNNVNEEKVISPLNKEYTLSLGVLNSLNEFVDITPTLVRWDDNDKQIKFEDSDTDLYKFNSGYFIANGIPDVVNTLEETINDAAFIEERNVLKLAINTYAYKLIGPLYLKAVLNHIQEFNYNIYGIYNPESENDKIGTLWVEGYLTYNCPHILEGTAKDANDADYVTFEDGKLSDINSFIFYRTKPSGKDLVSANLAFHDKDFVTYYETKYDKARDVYKTKVVKKYYITNGDTIFRDGEYFYDYLLGVRTPQSDTIFIEGLSATGSINLSLLGSGKIKVNGWRFHNTVVDRKTRLTYELEAYPKYQEEFRNLRLYLIDVLKAPKDTQLSTFYTKEYIFSNSKEFICINLAEKVFNGRTTIEFDWDDRMLSRKLYVAALMYDVYNTETGKIAIDEDGNSLENLIFIPKGVKPRGGKGPVYMWLLTTELFNSSFIPGKPDFIDNYFNPINYLSAFDRKTTLNIGIKPNVNVVDSEPTETIDGELFTKDENKASNPYRIITNEVLQYKYSPEVFLVDEELYPDYIKISNKLVSNITHTSQFTLEGDNNYYNATEFNNRINEIIGAQTAGNDKLFTLHKDEQENKLISIIDVTNRDTLACTRAADSREITNAFDNVKNALPIVLENTLTDAATILAEYDHGENLHYISFIYIPDYHTKVDSEFDSKNDREKHDAYFSAQLEVGNSNFTNGAEALATIENKGETIFPFDTYASEIYNAFNGKINEKLFFVLLFDAGAIKELSKSVGDTELAMMRTTADLDDDQRRATSLRKCARCWWRMKDNRWALIKFYIRNPKTTSRVDFINSLASLLCSSLFVTNFVYCFAKQVSLSEAGIYAPIQNPLNFKYNNYYSFNMAIHNTLNLTLNESTIVFTIEDKEYTAKGDVSGGVSGSYFNAQTVLKFNSTTNLAITKIDSHIHSVKSSDLFFNQVNRNFTDFRNLDISSGLDVDENGKLLNTANLYELDKGKLKIFDTPYIYIDTSGSYDSDIYNKLLYKGNTPGEPTIRYDVDGHDEDWTLIDYKGAIVTPQTI